jgi:murein DD-endopeptidase MepM/ murein hydrolase activator NlpD
MKFYTYQKDSVSYRRHKFFKWKYLIYFLLIQICIATIFIFTISSLYDTPKEKKLKGEVSYLINEFDKVNKRIIESDAILGQISANDSIIYQSIFDVSDVTGRKFDVYYENDSINDYSGLVKETNQRISKLDNKMSYEFNSLNKLVIKASNHQEMLTHIPAIQPIDNKDLRKTASGWGFRIHPVYKIRKFHYGIDFTARSGTPIYATGDGKIQYVIPSSSKSSQGYGNLIIIEHGWYYRTLYAHMSKFNVKVGDQVKRGDIIGYVGNTGISTGPHLHYEVIYHGRKVNPVNYFFNDLTPEEYHRIVQISTSIKKSYD